MPRFGLPSRHPRRNVLSPRHSAVGMAWILLLATGCTGLPPAAQDFGTVAEVARDATVVGTATARELKRLRDHTIQMNLQRLALAGPEPGFPSPADLDEALTPTVVLKRMQTAETLVSYGRLLLAFAGSSGVETRHAAVERFRLRVKGLPVPEQRLGGKDLEALASALDGSVGEPHQPHAVPRLIGSSHAQIGELCDRLAADFDPAYRDSLSSHFIITTERLLARADEALESARSAEERRQALAAIELAHTNRVRRSIVFPHLVGALTALKTTHAELFDTIESGEEPIQTLPALREAVMSLQTALDLLD